MEKSSYTILVPEQNDKMQKLQNKALRLCLHRDNKSNVSLLHKDSEVNYVQDRRDINLL